MKPNPSATRNQQKRNFCIRFTRPLEPNAAASELKKVIFSGSSGSCSFTTKSMRYWSVTFWVPSRASSLICRLHWTRHAWRSPKSGAGNTFSLPQERRSILVLGKNADITSRRQFCRKLIDLDIMMGNLNSWRPIRWSSLMYCSSSDFFKDFAWIWASVANAFFSFFRMASLSVMPTQKTILLTYYVIRNTMCVW